MLNGHYESVQEMPFDIEQIPNRPSDDQDIWEALLARMGTGGRDKFQLFVLVAADPTIRR
jgi:hypothetical protein